MPGADRLVELALAVASFHLFLLAVFRRYGLEGLGVPLSFRSPDVVLGVVLLLVAFRVLSNRSRPRPSPRLLERIRPGRWLDGLGLPGLILALVFLSVFWIFHHHGGRLGNDGVMNFIYVRSLVLDGDFDLTNEFEDFVPDKFQIYAEMARVTGTPPDPTNEPGPAFLWAPGFALTHVLVGIARWLGSPIAADGYSYPYINAVSLMGLLYGFAAVALSHRIASRYFDPRLTAVAVSVLWLSSTLYWYTVYEPTMPHATAAFVVAVYLMLWLRVRDEPSARGWVYVALAGGVLLSIQRYLVFLLVAPALTAVSALSRGARPTRQWLVRGAIALAAFVLAASPLLVYNYARTGTFLRLVDVGSFALRYWASPRVGELLFSSRHGLFSWTPAALLAVFGLVVFLAKERRLAAALLLTLSAGVYLLASTWDWYAGYAFGSRRTTEAFVIFAIGFCAAFEFFLRRPRVMAGAFVVALVGWNVVLSGQLKRGELPPMDTFGFAQAASRGAVRWYERLGHPFSIPANWIFAWRYGVSPDRFDWIYGHREYNNLSIDLGTDQDRYFVGRGWSAPESAAGASYRWSSGADSSFLVSLFQAFDYRLRLTVEPSRHPEGAPQAISIRVNGRSVSTVTLAPGWQTVETIVPSDYWSPGLNEITLTYLWTVRAGDVYGGSDPRPIAIRLARLELRIEK